MFGTGDVVMAKDIKAKPQLNGVVGKVICQLEERYGVLFPEPFGEKSLKRANLQLVKKAPSEQQPKQQPEEEKREQKTAFEEDEFAEGCGVEVARDAVELEKHCKTHPGLPAWNKKKARHAGRTGRVITADPEEGVYQISFETGEECWFPREAITPAVVRARSPAVSSLAPSYKCPVKVLCDPVDTQQIPGGMLRQDTVLQRDRKVGFDEDHIDVALYDASKVATKEEKEQLRKQEEEAKIAGEKLAKRRQGVVSVEKDEAVERSAIDKEEHKRRRGLRGAYQNDTTELEIKLRQQRATTAVQSKEDDTRTAATSQEDLDMQLAMSSNQFEEQIELASNEDIYRFAIQEEEVRELGGVLSSEAASRKLVKKSEQPRFMSPADIFSSQGWAYNEAEEVTSPPKKEKKTPPKEVPPSSEAAPVGAPNVTDVRPEDMKNLLTQINNLGKIAEVLRGNNEDLKAKYKRLETAYEVQEKDIRVLRKNREAAEAELKKIRASGNTETDDASWQMKFEKLKTQMTKGYESMQALEEKNVYLIKLAKLFEAHDRLAYHRAVKLLPGSPPPGDSEETHLRKTVMSLKQSNEELEKKYASVLKKLEAGGAGEASKNKGSSTVEGARNGKKKTGGDGGVAAQLEDERRKHAESKRLLALFQQKLKTQPAQPEAEGKVDSLKTQLTLHQDKLIRVKEERDKLQKDLKKEKEKNKELRAQAQKKK